MRFALKIYIYPKIETKWNILTVPVKDTEAKLPIASAGNSPAESCRNRVLVPKVTSHSQNLQRPRTPYKRLALSTLPFWQRQLWQSEKED